MQRTKLLPVPLTSSHCKADTLQVLSKLESLQTNFMALHSLDGYLLHTVYNHRLLRLGWVCLAKKMCGTD